MIINNLFEIGSIVFLKTDQDQKPRIVHELLVSINGVVYKVMQGAFSSWHYDFELSTEKDFATTAS